ncbi:MAG TPA: molecular chaperone TorD family protein [Vicinamibacterales bacterium]|nr:molecular chaperone TorD family protein [Vicinamibacterales bacterium]HOQ59212.1 molecular chaperone TorD family protein [Vicinamibacterales bacterium]HPK70705.1 molecular chaperone TorD family protein [Vicinamibacterales bacterium]
MTEGLRRSEAGPEALLLEAAAWRLIALLFECPGPGWQAHVAALGRDCRDPALQAAAHAAQTEASEGLYHSLFGAGGPVSLREVTYAGGMRPGYLLSELGAYYEAFAYRPGSPEPPDHLSVEAGFVSYLAMKQAYAAASNDPEGAGITADAMAAFCAEHLAGMAEPVARALEAGGPPYLALAGRALLERAGPPRGSPLPLGGAGSDNECGQAECGTV